jgi:hypothetical protein
MEVKIQPLIPFQNSILFSSGLEHTLFITWGPYATFHGMARKCHIEGSMITAV